MSEDTTIGAGLVIVRCAWTPDCHRVTLQPASILARPSAAAEWVHAQVGDERYLGEITTASGMHGVNTCDEMPRSIKHFSV